MLLHFAGEYGISGERPAAKAVRVTFFSFFPSSAIEIFFFIWYKRGTPRGESCSGYFLLFLSLFRY